MSDPIDRRGVIDAINTWDKFGVDERNRIVRWHEGLEPYVHLRDVVNAIINMPSAPLTLYGYPVEHLAMIAMVLQKENLPPERVAEMLSDIGRIVEMVRDEFEEMLRNAIEGCAI